MGNIWTGQTDTLADVLKKIDDALALLTNSTDVKADVKAIGLLSEAGNRLECYIACNDDNGQDEFNADAGNHVTG
jgi:hypothetical protein